MDWSMLPYMFLAESSNRWRDAVSKWYNEHQYYTYSTGSGNGHTVEHFTQVMWAASTHIGCGYYRECTNMLGSGRYNNVAVCRYSPAGNIGLFNAQVRWDLTHHDHCESGRDTSHRDCPVA